MAFTKRRRNLDVDDVTISEEDALKRAVTAAALGNAMEWFDFGVYAYLATTLAKVFFPDSGGALGLLATFGAFTVSFLIRPFGGAFFGRLGDRVGRQKTLATTMLMMAVATVSLGLIPSYNTIGFWAPILLLLARLVQGFSTGGEYGGATTFVSEYSPDKTRGFMSAWLDVGTLSGYVLGALIVTVLSAVISPDALTSWGWRIPFILAGPLGAIGLYMRLKLEETPAYEDQRKDAESREKEKVPAFALFTENWRPMLVCIGLVLVFNVIDYMLLTYMPTYLTSTLHAGSTAGLMLIVIVMLVMICVTPFGGKFSDRFGRKPVLMAGSLGTFILAWPALQLIQNDTTIIRFAGLLILGMLLMCFSSTIPSTLPALFPTAIRYSAVAIAFNISVSLFGGTTPLGTEALSSWAASNNWAIAKDIPAFYLMVGAAIGVITVLFYKETAQQPLEGSNPIVETRSEAKEVVEEYKDPESEFSQADWAQDYAASQPEKPSDSTERNDES